jgi:hypothetical protein
VVGDESAPPIALCSLRVCMYACVQIDGRTCVRNVVGRTAAARVGAQSGSPWPWALQRGRASEWLWTTKEKTPGRLKDSASPCMRRPGGAAVTQMSAKKAGTWERNASGGGQRDGSDCSRLVDAQEHAQLQLNGGRRGRVRV